ncbi:right-handed parallel beta-helix repeat-containing protein [Methanobrevibacter oralis]|uniref:right-handed parallel beta-helix repeat-containing protein n=1 Tax=Methanobrevibacter oralis TaxID=66851 RepID=UPI000D0FC397|nr:right-handed parallel beta-helix repeat-containing protein [Methanobrevibacter oralis]
MTVPNFAAALFVMGDSVVVRNDTFSDNSAYNAGAIVFGSNNTLVDDCLFIRNSAIKYGGGAIDDFGMDLKNNTISNSVFKKNSAKTQIVFKTFVKIKNVKSKRRPNRQN